jgi:Dolichyl-phosphate-mannose-protein mannosyltransferase
MRIRFKDTPWFVWTILALCAGCVIFEITQIVQYAFQPNQMDFGEGFTMYIAKLWANGQFQWNPAHQPYMTLIYGVVYPTILKPFVLLFGPDLRIGRIYCLIATVIIAIFIFLIARRFSKNKLICTLAALLPMLHPGYREWILQARCDMVAIMFSVIGVYIAIRWQSDKRIFWSIPLFLLAIFTKQTAIIGAGAVCLYLLITNHKLFLIYTGIFLVSLAAIILAGNMLTAGQFFKQFWDYDQTIPFIWTSAKIAQNYQDVFYPLIVLLPGILIILLLKPNLYKQYLIPLLWLLISLIVTCVLLFRKGAFINYGMELIIISGLCFALLLEHFKNIRLEKIHIVMIWLLVALQIILCFSVSPIPMPNKAYAIKVAAVKEIIENTDLPILTENAGLVLSAGKTPYYEPFIYTNLERLGYFDENIIVDDLNNQRMDYLVLKTSAYRNSNNDHLTQQVQSAIKKNYKIIYQTTDGYFWYDFCVYESDNLYKTQHP